MHIPKQIMLMYLVGVGEFLGEEITNAVNFYVKQADTSLSLLRRNIIYFSCVLFPAQSRKVHTIAFLRLYIGQCIAALFLIFCIGRGVHRFVVKS